MGAGKGVRIREAGVAVSVVAQACELVSGKLYQIIDRDRAVWDRSVAAVVKDNGSAVSAANILYIHYLTGRVEFIAAYTPTTPITVEVDYRPMTTIAYARTADLTETVDLEDITTFATAETDTTAGAVPSRRKQVTMESSTATVGGFYDFTDNFATELRAGTTVILNFQDDYSDDTDIVYMESFMPSLSANFNVEAMNQTTLNFESTYPLEYE